MEQPWIYLALLGAVIMLVGWKKPSGNSKYENEFSTNMEATLEHFVHEVGEENEKVLDVVEQVKKEYDLRFEAMRHRMDSLETALAKADERASRAAIVEVQAQMDQLSRRTAVSAPLMVTSSNTNPVEESIEQIQYVKEEQEKASSKAAEAVPSIRTRYEQLFALVDAGKTDEQIAQELHMNRGEVELIRHLSQQESERHV